MSEPFVGEIRMFAGNFPPVGWAFCDGSVLSIAENDVLFTLIGTTYGGNGTTTFALPDLRGRVPVHQGTGPGQPTRLIGEAGGSEAVTLTQAQMPSHFHVLNATSTAATAAAGPNGGMLGASSVTQFYGSTPGGGGLAGPAMGVTGGSQPHDNVAPFQAVSFIIALFGIFPSQS